jgi:hypothetical protein
MDEKRVDFYGGLTSYGCEIMGRGCHLLGNFYFVANGWMDGWMDEKGASFLGFGLVCLTLWKL